MLRDVFMVGPVPRYSQGMGWIREIWWRWQSRRFHWKQQRQAAAGLSDYSVAYYAEGNGNSALFERACQVEARRRRIQVEAH